MDQPLPIPLDNLIVCTHCDAAFTLERPEVGQRAVCARCGTVLITPRRKAGLQIIAVSVAITILIIAATVFPFLSISAAGATNSVSILDAALAFSDGPLVALALTTAALIIFVPLARVLLTIYVLVPIVLDRPPARRSTQAFRLAEALRPWSMAEIFVLGCAVALIKISDLADVAFGPAFWMFSGLVVLVVVQDNFLCRWSVWKSLDKTQTS
ncbi:paraquat-inducible protein A [Litoreibacter halocynthiae]|uniref:Paraquat-inducible protein A n=1 Tax=Litoreibacter halocynthiae TaxID=1242689 RepID=A0A4R7LM66_9RHOB|nr:paraquat-inducible protein A [Litoreibacter halocynthiae]TDT77083.1 paraquat-inducible protein A [Litoreibacter halocynthiae]